MSGTRGAGAGSKSNAGPKTQTTVAGQRRERARGGKEWATFERILHGRTLHINSLSPLHPPQAQASDNAEHDNRIDGELTQQELDATAEELASYLSLRLNDSIFAPPLTTSTQDGQMQESQGSFKHFNGTASGGIVQQVRATFLQESLDRSNRVEALFDDDIPKPWVIEIELSPSRDVVDRDGIRDEAKERASKQRREHAHLVFLSSKRRISSTHYPLLIWKAPSAKIFAAAADTEQGVEEESLAAGYRQQLSSRILVNYMLDFVARYFDCRLSHLPPLTALRGAGLETLAERLLDQMRQEQSRAVPDEDFQDASEQHAIELTYALPQFVQSDKDSSDHSAADHTLTSEQDLDDLIMRGSEMKRKRKRQERDPQPGPSPELNTISLTVPPQITLALIRSASSLALTLLEEYLAEHTSLHLSRLSLVRIGMAGVYIGAPALSARSLGNGGGEVRLKFTLPTDQRASSQNGTSASDEAAVLQRKEAIESRIATTLQHLISLADGYKW